MLYYVQNAEEFHNGTIDDFSDAFDLMDRYRTKVGLSTTIVDDMEDLNAQLRLDLQGRLSSIEEVDMAERCKNILYSSPASRELYLYIINRTSL